MDGLVSALQRNPELAVFLTLAPGSSVGKRHLGSAALGCLPHWRP